MRAFAVGQRREMAENSVARRGASIALACRAFGASETSYRYGPKLRAETGEIADLLTGLTDARKTWGVGLCFLDLRNGKGHPWNCNPAMHVYRHEKAQTGLPHILRARTEPSPSRAIAAQCPAG